MAKSISVKRKKTSGQGRPGRPATGTDPLYGIRMDDDLIHQILDWAKANSVPSRSEAIRRLVELGLKPRKWGGGFFWLSARALTLQATNMIRSIAGAVIALALLYMADEVFADGKYARATMKIVTEMRHSVGK